MRRPEWMCLALVACFERKELLKSVRDVDGGRRVNVEAITWDAFGWSGSERVFTAYLLADKMS